MILPSQTGLIIIPSWSISIQIIRDINISKQSIQVHFKEKVDLLFLNFDRY